MYSCYNNVSVGCYDMGRFKWFKRIGRKIKMMVGYNVWVWKVIVGEFKEF